MFSHPLVLFALAIAPGFALAIYFYLADKYEKEPIRLLFQCFSLGMFSILPALFLGNLFEFFGLTLGESSLSIFLYAFITVALSEELSKYVLFTRKMYKHEEFNEPYDGIIYAVMVSLGFATLENVLYVLEYGYTTAIARMFTAVPAHATFGVLMGFFVGYGKFNSHPRFFKGLGLFMAIIFHGAYDYFLMNNNYEWLFIGALLSLVVGIYLSRKAILIHQDQSPFNPKNIF